MTDTPLWSLIYAAPLFTLGAMLFQCAWQAKLTIIPYFFKKAAIITGIVTALTILAVFINFYLIFIVLPVAVIIGAMVLLGATLARDQKNDVSKALPLWGRFVCALIGLLCMVWSVVYLNRENFATIAYRQAISEGDIVSIAEDTVWKFQSLAPLDGFTVLDLRRWAPLAALPPSPEKKILTAMVSPAGPPKEFWDTLLSLPPTPERHEIISSFSNFLSSETHAQIYIRLYDQKEQDTKTMQMLAQNTGENPSWLIWIINNNRADALKEAFKAVTSTLSTPEELVRTAIDVKNTEILFFLFDKGVPPYSRWRFTAFQYAVEQNNEYMTKALLKNGYTPENDCAPYSSYGPPMDLPLTLLAENPTQCLEKGNTALHIAAINETSCDIINLLLAYGADVNALNEQSETPLHLTVAHDWQKKRVDCLLNAGADPSLQDIHGLTALHVAIQKKHTAAAIKILQLRPDLAYIEDAQGKTPLDYAQSSYDMMEVFEGIGIPEK